MTPHSWRPSFVAWIFSALITFAGISFPHRPAQAETPYPVQWTTQFGAFTSNGIAVDENGNAYLAGEGVSGLPGDNSTQPLVRSYDTAGSFRWLYKEQVGSNPHGTGIAYDGVGSVYLTGFGHDGGLGHYYPFVSKYDTSGNRDWRVNATEIRTLSNSWFTVAADATGPYFGGYTINNLEPSDVLPPNGGAFFRKFDASGLPLWTRQYFSGGNDGVLGATVDQNGNAFFAGVHNTTQVQVGTVGNLQKLTGAGDFAWQELSTGLPLPAGSGVDSHSRATGVATDGHGSVYLVGHGALTHDADRAGFITKFEDGIVGGNPTGEFVARQFIDSGPVGSKDEYANGVALDGKGHVYVVGSTEGALSGNVSAGLVDAFVAKYDGNNLDNGPLWIKQFGTTGDDSATGVAVDKFGHVYVTGRAGGILEGSSSPGLSFLMKLTADAGTTQFNPILPTSIDGNSFVFTNVEGDNWFDPPLVNAFTFTAEPGTLFAGILDFPTGFNDPLTVSVDGSVLGQFGPGDSVDFASFPGGGVSQFVVSGINPLVDAEDQLGFPLRLEFTTPTGSFRMTAVPEPGALTLAASSVLVLLAHGRFCNRNIRRRSAGSRGYC